MMVVLRPTYTLTVEVQDSSGVLYNGLTGETGCDAVLEMVRDRLKGTGLGDVTVSLARFEHRA